MERKINPDLIKNAQKYKEWVPIELREQMYEELGRYDIPPYPPPNALIFIIASMARKPGQSLRKAQTEWVWRIFCDLNLDNEDKLTTIFEPRFGLKMEIYLKNGKKRFRPEFYKEGPKIWARWNSGWNGGMWESLSAFFLQNKNKITYDSFIEMERKTGSPYGQALKNIIFSEGASSIKFINWMWENPLEVKE